MGLLRKFANGGGQRGNIARKPVRSSDENALDRRTTPRVGMANPLLFGNTDRLCGLLFAKARSRWSLRWCRSRRRGCQRAQSHQGRFPTRKPPGSLVDKHRSYAVGRGILRFFCLDVHFYGRTHGSCDSGSLLDQLARFALRDDLDLARCRSAERPGRTNRYDDDQRIALDGTGSCLSDPDFEGERGCSILFPANPGCAIEFLRRASLCVARRELFSRSENDQRQFWIRHKPCHCWWIFASHCYRPVHQNWIDRGFIGLRCFRISFCSRTLY
mmetsp:Transcript_17016/g.39118  ORF Transcript_17016/g.39118 Transcript_17016/m.39118 type:complete len:272 (+) Transcript_17016:458-1273(+)